MKAPRSLEVRLALAIGLGVTFLWIAAATVTANILRHEMNEVFDSALEETAQRILPLAVLDIVGREEQGLTQTIATLRKHDEYFTYVVRDAQGRVLLKSHDADESIFPPYQGMGFRDTATHRLYYDAALQETVTIAVAEPLEHRATVAREMQGALALPLFIIIPLSLLAIFAVVRLSFRPVRKLRNDLAARSVQDLSAVPDTDLPSEVAPIAAAVNQLLLRLKDAFEAERSFAANAAHELRNPVAGAIAQAQRLQAETIDRKAAQRAADIEMTLKRLARLSEKLMQLARAEGGRLRSDKPADLRPILQLIVADFERAEAEGRLDLKLPSEPVLSSIDPDAFGILCRNLIENALRHGQLGTPVAIRLEAEGRLVVRNEGPVIPAEVLVRLTSRFERAAIAGEGSGLGLAIVRTIAERAGGSLILHSPAPGGETGFEAVVSLSTRPSAV
jgi:two-component system OmpR family sensor kinase